MTITEATRRDILDYMRAEGIWWAGRLEEIPFLERVYDIDHLPSRDHRYDTARKDVCQHRVSNPGDWDDYWVFDDDRFGLLHGPDEVFLRFLCEMVHPVVRSDEEEAQRLVVVVNESLARDGWELVEERQLGGRPAFAPVRLAVGSSVTLASAHAVAAIVDANYLTRQVTRMASAVQEDPELAIGQAKEFVETICKTILELRGIDYGDCDDLPRLTKRTCQVLKLTRGDVPESAQSAEVLRKLLSNLATVSQGVAELRNLHGTGHGKAATADSSMDRHAELAVNAAIALGVFLFRTHLDQ